MARRSLSLDDIRQVSAQLRHDGVPAHPLLPVLWRRGWLLAPQGFRTTVNGAVLWASWFTGTMLLMRLPQGLGGLLAIGLFVLLLAAIGCLELRWSLSRRQSDLLIAAALLIAGCLWLIGLRRLQLSFMAGFGSLRELLIFLPIQFVTAVVIAWLIAWIRRRKRQLAPWPLYLDRALVAEVF